MWSNAVKIYMDLVREIFRAAQSEAGASVSALTPFGATLSALISKAFCLCWRRTFLVRRENRLYHVSRSTIGRIRVSPRS